VLGARDRAELKRVVADANTPQKMVKRAKGVRLRPWEKASRRSCARSRSPRPRSGAGRTISPRPVSWGLLKGRSKPPGKKPITRGVKRKVVDKTVRERPVNATHGSVRRMAGEMGISHTSV